jgi:hypothetical protein
MPTPNTNQTASAAPEVRTFNGSAEIDAFVWEQADKASLQWFRAQSANPYAAIYLYYRRGELAALDDRFHAEAHGWTLGRPERLSPACTRQQIKAQIEQAARWLPFLPV